ncbi:SMP-30/gluconolactonase/LRE family protein [Kribbella deserti]|uniref:SMP-30/gluconolactonase/LRE family protein n=1 Tax=Kribbella deserti TaxID=1926257 RepID=A0ABV6QHN7_9ACTN
MSRRRTVFRAVQAVAGMLALSGLVLSAAPASASGAFPARVELPNGFQPEGIAIDRAGQAYFGSRLNGDIYTADLRTGEGRILAKGPGTGSLGMKADNRGRLFVAGGGGGDGRVIDTRTGKLLASYTFTKATPTFVNDVVLSKTAAWFTDSNQPVLYKVPLGRHGLPPQSAVQTIPLTGDYQHVAGFNANGISLTPDGRSLLIVQSATGFLFKVDPSTGVTQRVDLGSPTTLLTNGDGLLLLGNRLYVVQNRLNKIGVYDLNHAGTRGRLVKEITSTDFDVPTTAAAFGARLYLPNARFTTPPTADTPYWATAVRR